MGVVVAVAVGVVSGLMMLEDGWFLDGQRSIRLCLFSSSEVDRAASVAWGAIKCA